MIIGIGMDMVEVERVDRLLRRFPSRALSRLFTPQEVAHCRGSRCPAESFAARFAAKEAAFKALGTGVAEGGSWKDAEIVSGPNGAPSLRLHGGARRLADARGVARAHVTLTHTGALAAACVVLEGVANPPSTDA